jgi:hypothetical protein
VNVEKSLEKMTTKYQCMVSGEKVMTPCSSCENPKGCLSRAMHYKENEEMGDIQEKAVLKVTEDGGVVSCAKNLSAGECGFKAGAKVCAACGAAPVMQKANMMPDDEDIDEDEMEDVVEQAQTRRRPAPSAPMAGGDDMEGMPEEEEEEEEDMKMMGMMKPKRRSRQRALSSMGVKSESVEDIDNVFICQLERKVLSGENSICANCEGGCVPENGMPGLIDVEGMALDMFGGKVLWSGYVSDDDVFVIDLLAKDGRAVELIAEGETGEIVNIHRLSQGLFDSPFGQKALDPNFQVEFIDIKQAEKVAVKALEDHVGTTGRVLQADSEIFEGHDAYVFEIEASNKKQYDMYVGLDGTVLGYDELDATEVEEIEAEAAEIALKRAYSDEMRDEMAKEGMALPDGSYPIRDEEDLKNAIQAFGRAKDKEKAQAHIMKRAKALGKEDLIPENWISGKKVLSLIDVSPQEAEFAEFELKAAYSVSETEKLIEEKKAMADGSMPINNEEDLRNALRSYSRAGDKEKAKLHIMKRAMDLKLTDLIPMDWVPKDVAAKFSSGGEKANPEMSFLSSLLEFELLAAEHDLDNNI